MQPVRHLEGTLQQNAKVNRYVLGLCNEKRDSKKNQYEAEIAKEYGKANRRVQQAVKKAKEDWIATQCEEIEY